MSEDRRKHRRIPLTLSIAQPISLEITSGELTNIPGTNITVPDGYQIVLTLKDLVIRSRNLHNLQGPNTTVKAITDRVRVAEAAKNEAEEALEIALRLQQAAIQSSNEAKRQENVRRAAAQAAAEKEANDN